MRVLLVTQRWPRPALSGESMIASSLIAQTSERHELHLAALESDDGGVPEPIDELASSERIEPVPRRSGWGRRFANLWSPIPGPMREMTSPAAGERLGALVRRLEPDVVQLSSLGLALYGEYLPPGVSKVLVSADSLPRTIARIRDAEGRASVRLRLSFAVRKARNLERIVYPTFDRVVMVSELDAAATRSWSPRTALRVIPLGVDVDRFTPGEPAADPALGMVGNYAYRPNERAAVHLLRDVLPAVRRRHPGVEALVVGTGPSAEMTELAEVTPGATVTGFVPDVRPYLRRMTVFVAWLTAGSGVKGKVLEAMSSGIPVVGSPIAFEGIDGRSPEHFVRAHDVAGAAEAVSELLADEGARRTLAERSRALVESRYAWPAQARRYEELWAELAPGA